MPKLTKDRHGVLVCQASDGLKARFAKLPIRADSLGCTNCDGDAFVLGLVASDESCPSCDGLLIGRCISCDGMFCFGCVERAVREHRKENNVPILSGTRSILM